MVNRKVFVENSFLFFACLLLLLLPPPWISACVAAAAIHEAGHYAAIYILGGKQIRLGVAAFSAKMELSAMSIKKELICAIAGPAAGLMLLLFARWLPRTAVCAFCQSIWNLLPIYPLDGGRIVSCIAKLVFAPPKAECVVIWIGRICRVTLMLIGCYVSWRYGILVFALLIGILICIRRN